MSEEIINKVAESGIITIDLEEYYPREEITVFDIKPFLFRELILKEKEFREKLKTTDWEGYRDKYIALTNTADAIIPMWAYMLIASYLQPVAKNIDFGSKEQVIQKMLVEKIQQIDENKYVGKRIVIKGCGDIVIPESAYVAVTNKLRPVVKSLMFGEPCSTVPVYKAAAAISSIS
ncbi:MAG: DUF2480 family protein [Agriterribacter sp.]